MWNAPADHPLRRLFAGLTEHAFMTSIGVTDPPLIDYVSELLTRFIHFSAVYRLQGPNGRPLTEVVEMAMEAEEIPPEGRTKREYHRHIGDFTLFWTGLFPEAVKRRHSCLAASRGTPKRRCEQARPLPRDHRAGSDILEVGIRHSSKVFDRENTRGN